MRQPGLLARGDFVQRIGMVAGILATILLGTRLWAQEQKQASSASAGSSVSGSLESASPGKTEGSTGESKRGHSAGRLPPYYAAVVDAKQREEIYRIQQEYAPKIAELKAKLEALIAERDEKIAAVLTAEQRAKIEAAKSEARKRRSPAESDRTSPKKKKPASATGTGTDLGPTSGSPSPSPSKP